MENKSDNAVVTPAPTFKQLKVTNHRGNVNYMPNNNINKSFHENKRRILDRDKREKYIIEVVELEAKEAAQLGVSEAIQYLNPPKARGTQSNGNDALVALLAEQMKRNSDLEARLTALETPKKK